MSNQTNKLLFQLEQEVARLLLTYYIYHSEERKKIITETVQALTTKSVGGENLLNELKNSAVYKVSADGEVQKYPFNPLQKIYS